MIGRRTFLVASAGALIAARRRDLLGDAIARAGGEAALLSARILIWTGTAKVNAGGRSVDIGVSTRVEPFLRARSDSWFLKDGPGKTRSLIIEPHGGSIERDGARVPMPPAMLAHERSQYALYGLMKLVTARDRGAWAERGREADTLILHHPRAPTTRFGFTPDARLAWAANQIPAADNGSPVDQRFDFSGEFRSAGISWPQRIQIAQGGTPYFDLRLDSFRTLASWVAV